MAEIDMREQPRGVQQNDMPTISSAELQRLRIDQDAERILTEDLRRRYWTAADRDAIARSIRSIIERERRIFA